MFEATTTSGTRDAIHKAHEERAQALRDAWHWLFASLR